MLVTKICLLIFSDTNDSSSDSDVDFDGSFHHSNKSSGHKSDQSGTFIVSDPISSTIPDLPIINEDFAENDTPQIILAMSSNETDTSNVSDNVRRSSRKRTPNTKYTTDYISPTVSPTASRVVSPKRSHSPSAASTSSIPQPPTPVQNIRKKTKQSPLNSPNRQQIVIKKKGGLTDIGNLQLPWPRYGIRNALFEGKMYSVTRTCPLDTGLFVLYYAYKAGTSQFRDLFERDTLEIYATLRRTFQIVDSDDWTMARLYWLTKHNLLNHNVQGDVYDIENTLTAIVFNFVRTMQAHPIKSKCSCDACPKQIRSSTNFHITLKFR